MAIINRPPIGFLSWLDSKTLGDSPNTYQSLVQPGIEMSEFYTASIPVQAQAVAPAVTPANVNSIVATINVPNTEAWLVETLSTTFVANAVNAVGRVQARLVQNGNTLRPPMVGWSWPIGGAVLGANYDAAVPWRHWIIPPGTIIQAFLAIASGPGDAAMTVGYRRLTV